jgi:hypothetical protein
LEEVYGLVCLVMAYWYLKMKLSCFLGQGKVFLIIKMRIGPFLQFLHI